MNGSGLLSYFGKSITSHLIGEHVSQLQSEKMYKMHEELKRRGLVGVPSKVEYIHWGMEYSIDDLQWKWDDLYATVGLSGKLSRVRLLRLLDIRFTGFFSSNGCNGISYCMFKWPDEKSKVIKPESIVPKQIENSSEEFRIDWLLRHFKALPVIWYDDEGNPYIITGDAAIRKFDVS